MILIPYLPLPTVSPKAVITTFINQMKHKKLLVRTPYSCKWQWQPNVGRITKSSITFQTILLFTNFLRFVKVRKFNFTRKEDDDFTQFFRVVADWFGLRNFFFPFPLFKMLRRENSSLHFLFVVKKARKDALGKDGINRG